MNIQTLLRRFQFFAVYIAILLFVCLSVSNSGTAQTACVPASKPFVALGTNWSGAGQSTPYVNLWHGARIWNQTNTSIGADGWPTGSIELIFQTLDGEEYKEYVGTYKMQYKGPISAIESGPAPIKFSNQVYNAATGMTTLDVTWTPELVVAPFYEYFWIKFKQRVTDIKLMRLGFGLDSPDLIDPKYMKLIKSIGFTTLRFMDFNEANSNHSVKWGDRIKPNSTDGFEMLDLQDGIGYDQGTRGGNWERAIQISNELDADMWINIPIFADDDYVLQLAKLLKDRLKPTLNINIEWGNETWNYNGGFHCFGMVKKLAEEAIDRGDDVAYDRDLWSTHRRLPAYKLKKFGEIFATVFGQNEICKRIRPILCGQVAYGGKGDGWSIGMGLDYLATRMKVFPGDWIYAVAGTNYFGPIGGAGGKNSTQLLSELAEDISLVDGVGQYSPLGNGENPTGNRMDALASKAKSYGVKYYCYEGGPDLDYTSGGGSPTSQKTIALRSPQMKTLVKDMYTKWFSYYGDDALSCFFNGDLSPNYSNLYAFGEYIGESSPKIEAMTEMRQNPAPTLEGSGRNVIPGIIPVWRYAGYEDKDIGDDRGSMWPKNSDGWGGFIDYYTGAIKNGLYSIQIKRKNPPADATIRVLIDGKAINSGDIRIPRTVIAGTTDASGFGYTEVGQVEIGYGTHNIHFDWLSSSGQGEWRDIKFTLIAENPPFAPLVNNSSINVCSGNSNVKYEVKADLSVCEYKWSGSLIDAGAVILPAKGGSAGVPLSGSMTNLIYVDFSKIAVGTYRLKSAGCNDIGCSTPTVIDVVVATCGFTVAPSPVCLNSAVTFSPLPMANIASYQWDNGMINNSNRFTTQTSNTSYTYTYTVNGVYNIALKTIGTSTDQPEKFYYNTITVVSCNAPSVVTPLTYCQGQTGVPPVTATAINGGTGLKWYTVATGGTALLNVPTPTTLAAGTQSYFVSQMNGTKESDPTRLEVIISAAPAAPTVTAPASVTYCKDALGKVSDLTSKVTGTATLKWYESDASTTSTPTPAVPITSTEGTKQVYVSQEIGTCESPKEPINIVVTAPPAAPNVTGAIADKCLNTPVAQSELTSLVTPATGKTIQWHVSESSLGTATQPSINTSTIGTKSVWASQKEGECQSAKIKIDIVVTDGPAQFTVGGGGVTDCNTNLGQAITLSNSTNGVNYVLMVGSVPKDTVVGNGTPLSFAPQTEAGTYVVLATSTGNCQSTMTGNAKLTNTVGPIQQTLTGGGAIECGGADKTLTLGSTESGVTYLLIKDGKDTVDTKVGNGATQGFSGIQAPGKYSVRATRGTCETSMTDGEELTSPTSVKIFELSSTGTLDCSGAGSVTVAIPSSEQGVEYTLYKGTTAVGSKQIATGTVPINFANIKQGGTYTIKALNPLTKCVADMNGTKEIKVPEIPIVQTLIGTGSYCDGQPVPIIKLLNSELKVTYILKTGSGTSQTIKDTKPGTGVGFDFAAQAESNTYTVTASKGLGVDACTTEMSGSARLEKLPPSVGGAATATQAQIAKGGNTDININGYTGGITWETSTDGNSFAAIVPAQSNPSFNTGILATAGEYYYRAKVQSGTCTAVYSTIAQVSVTNVNNAGIASLAIDTICQGSTATLTLTSSTGIIQWQDSITGGTFTDITSPSSASQTTAALSQSTWYRAKVGSDYSNVVQVTTIAAPAGTVTGPANATAACEDNGIGYDLNLSPVNTTASYALYKDGQEQPTAIISNGKFNALKQAGTYTVKASLTKLPSCMSNMTGSFTIAEPKLPQAFVVSGGGSVCAGAIGGQADILLSNSEMGVSYALSDQTTAQAGTGLPLTFVKTLNAANADTYTIVAVNTSTQCVNAMEGRAEISIKSGVGEPTLVVDPQYCNLAPTKIEVGVDNATEKIWSITPAAAGTIDNAGNVTWSSTYTGPATIKVVVSNTVCSAETKEASLPTTVSTKSETTPIAGDSLVCRGNIVIYQVIPQVGITYNWSINANTTLEKDDSKGTITITYMEDLSKEGTTLTVTPESVSCGIGTSKTKDIKKDNGCDLFVPNILTTNTADKNSVWQLEGLENYPKMTIEIFNRWGAQVHTQSGKYDKPWDGTTSGQPLPTATYYYVIDKNDGTAKITGSVTVVRE